METINRDTQHTGFAVHGKAMDPAVVTPPGMTGDAVAQGTFLRAGMTMIKIKMHYAGGFNYSA